MARRQQKYAPYATWEQSPSHSSRFISTYSRLYDSAHEIFSSALARLKRSLWGQASDHEPNHRDVNQGFRCFRQALIVDLEPTMAPQPSERTFHNPAPRHHRESVPIFWLAHDLQP